MCCWQQLALMVALCVHRRQGSSHFGRRLFWRTRQPQVEASMVAAHTPRRSRATRVLLRALIVELGAALVPELGASTLSNSGIAEVAWSIGEGLSRQGGGGGRCALRNRSRRSMLLYWSRKSRVWAYNPRHGELSLGIPQRTRST